MQNLNFNELLLEKIRFLCWWKVILVHMARRGRSPGEKWEGCTPRESQGRERKQSIVGGIAEFFLVR
jgi:hypothetical protein